MKQYLHISFDYINYIYHIILSIIYLQLYSQGFYVMDGDDHSMKWSGTEYEKDL